jgi:hypothetical protein
MVRKTVDWSHAYRPLLGGIFASDRIDPFAQSSFPISTVGAFEIVRGPGRARTHLHPDSWPIFYLVADYQARIRVAAKQRCRLARSERMGVTALQEIYLDPRAPRDICSRVTASRSSLPRLPDIG